MQDGAAAAESVEGCNALEQGWKSAAMVLVFVVVVVAVVVLMVVVTVVVVAVVMVVVQAASFSSWQEVIGGERRPRSHLSTLHSLMIATPIFANPPSLHNQAVNIAKKHSIKLE